MTSITTRRAQRVRVERLAQAQVAQDEAAITGAARRTLPLSGAWREFWRHPSPWILAVFAVGSTVARLVVGGWQRSDLLLPLVMLALFPVMEWVIHVTILHWKPRRLGPVRIDPLLSRKHREHHADPRDIPLVFIPWKVFAWVLPMDTAMAVWAFPRLGLGLTFLMVLALFGFAYEWAHYLIHSDYKPKTKVYKAVWRNHRLHHYKNENYWFTVTTAGTADRLFRTYPDPATVTASATAKNLHGTQ